MFHLLYGSGSEEEKTSILLDIVLGEGVATGESRSEHSDPNSTPGKDGKKRVGPPRNELE